MEIRGKMKIQPIDIDPPTERVPIRIESGKPVLKSRLRKLFDRPFPNVLKTNAAEKPPVAAGEAVQFTIKDGHGVIEFDPSSVCLANLVQNFIEETNEKHSYAPTATKNGRNRCNCFNGNSNDSSDDEFDDFIGGSSETGFLSTDVSDIIKSMIPCASVMERNLLADTAKIIEKNNKIHKRKDDLRIMVTDGLSSIGYDSSICKSKWEKSTSFPAGDYEYIDVIIEGERLLIDIDFRSEFEIARSTGTYKAVLQMLPNIFVGKPDRLGQIVSIVSEAAKQSLKKKGMPLPPWRKADYMKAKWFSNYIRTRSLNLSPKEIDIKENDELIFSNKSSETDSIVTSSNGGEKAAVTVMTWKPPAIKPKSVDKGVKIVTGLASILKENP